MANISFENFKVKYSKSSKVVVVLTVIYFYFAVPVASQEAEPWNLPSKTFCWCPLWSFYIFKFIF